MFCRANKRRRHSLYASTFKHDGASLRICNMFCLLQQELIGLLHYAVDRQRQ